MACRCPGASKQTPHTGGGGTLRLLGSLPQRGHTTTFNLPFLSLIPPFGERILCPPNPPALPPGSVVCALCVHSLTRHGCHPGRWVRDSVEVG